MRAKKTVLIILSIVILIALVAVFRGGPKDLSEKYMNAQNLDEDIDGLVRENTYGQYLMQYAGSSEPQQDIVVDVQSYTGNEGVTLLDELGGEANVLLCDEVAYVEWPVEVAEAGFYQVMVEYYAPQSRGIDIERMFYINGEVPFVGADGLVFSRVWKDKKEITVDNQGNEIRSAQIDVPMWSVGYLRDTLGYVAEPYKFYFEAGKNTIAFESVNEPVAIKSVTLKGVEETIDYAAYQSIMTANTNNAPSDFVQIVQGEDSVFRSSPSLYPIYDRSAPDTEPYSVNEILLNMIGGNSWRVPGQWIEWDFEVPEDGFYNVGVKARQSYSRGFVSNRTIYIDGEIPFDELNQVEFKYTTDWVYNNLGAEDEAYEFYLEKGKHTLRMEVTLGDLGGIINDMEDSVYRLNMMYRKILVLTGTTPDEYRDYKIDEVYPEVIAGMDLESKRLYRIVDRVVAYSGQKADQIAIVQTMAEQLELFVEDPYRIPKSFVNFKNNISAVGTAIMNMSEAPLDVDFITVTSVGTKAPVKTANFIDKFAHEIRSFAASFTNDYNAIGNVYDTDEAIEVWILTGRDQSTILKSMIDDNFTPEYGISVNVKLVEAPTLLNAVIANKGPDVVLSAAQPEPVNYALRNAVEDLSQFEDSDEVLARFAESASKPFHFEGGLYALPETQLFNVLFYRKDILNELGLSVPNTWDELIQMLPTIQQENLTVAIPSTERLINNVSNPDMSGLLHLIYQNGGTVYNEEGTKATIDSEEAIKAFEEYTKFFNQYVLPTNFDFPNRFRSGEMPIGIQDYNFYNTLVVFAPEIRGLWDFTVIPGTLQEDGTIDRSAHTWGTCTFMLKQESETTKNNAWEFMKWWVSAESQTTFGREMEAVMGASARYATANIEAFSNLSWSAKQIEVLAEQRDWTVGMQEIAGGYFTPRHITNAVRKSINEKEDAREVLLDYVITINEEIDKKRREFGLSTD